MGSAGFLSHLAYTKSPLVIMSKNTNLWSVEEQLEEFSGKLNLKERDNQAYFCASREKISQNETLIRNLRHDVKEKRIELARCLNEDQEDIRTALHENESDQLTYQRSSAERCIEEKNQDVFDQVKKLNNLKHEQNQHKKKMKELELILFKLKRTSEIDSTSSKDDISDQRCRLISTRLDKVMLKITSARYVNTTYKRVLAYLERDSLSLPGRFNEVEGILEQQKQELAELKKIHSEARESADTSKKQRAFFEQDIRTGKDARDKKLTSIRKSHRQLEEEINSTAINVIRPQSQFNSKAERGAAQRRQSIFTPERKIQKAALENSLNRLQATVGASQVEDIPTAFNNQIQRQVQLLEKAEALQQQREKLASTVATAENQLNDIKYKATAKLLKYQDPESELKDQDQDILLATKNELSMLDLINEKITSINNAIDLFYSKTCQIVEEDAQSDEQPEKKIDSIINHLSGMRTASKVSLQSQDGPKVTTNKTEDIANKIMTSRCNLRIELPEEDEDGGPSPSNSKVVADEDEDELIETSYQSRDDVKKKSDQLVQQRRPRKKGGK